MNAPDREQARLIVGLEVHVQLLSQTKLFCSCLARFGGPPNSRICPVCAGFPGALPVPNRAAAGLAIRAVLALGGSVATSLEWDRKQYFYPDLPKGYQITQTRSPIGRGGQVVFDLGERNEQVQVRQVGIDHAHLEEDAGKSLHGGADVPSGCSAVDLNRAGTPLLEIVTRPELCSGRDARMFLTELRSLMVWNGVSDGNMQEGSLRCDANVNWETPLDGVTIRTPIIELKNLNSFRAVERAIDAEADRQWNELCAVGPEELARRGRQTRGWDDERGVSFLQREKESAADYRYLPEPDLLPVPLARSWIDSLQQQLVSGPEQIREELRTRYGLGAYDSRVIAAGDRAIVTFFQELAAAAGNPKLASNWLQQEVFSYLTERSIPIGEFPLRAAGLGALLQRLDRGEFPVARGREILHDMLQSGRSLEESLQQLGVGQINDRDLASACEAVLAANPRMAADWKSGKEQAAGPLIGQVRKQIPDAAPAKIREFLQQALASWENPGQPL